MPLSGRGSSTAWYRGPLSGSEGTGEANLRWDQANIGGMPLGPGELKAALAHGGLQVAPLELAMNQGRVHLAPRIRLSPGPCELSLAAGPLADRVQVDPAMCASMLRYAAPALANVTAVKGTVSVMLDSCRIPLADPGSSDISGRLMIHSLEMGSGPMLHAMSVLLGGDTAGRLREESVVAFRMKDRRIYHDGLELMFPLLTIRTSGSVGLDQTVDITAAMPVPPKWLGNNAAMIRAVANQTINLPVRGRLDKPELDPRAVAQASAQFAAKAAGAAGTMIGDRVNQGPREAFRAEKVVKFSREFRSCYPI